MSHEILMDVILALIALMGTVLYQSIKQNEKARLALEVIKEIAPAAVVAAEKSGLTGNEKFKKAVYEINSTLNSIGITDTDQTMIKNAVEAQWAKLSKDGTLDQYKKEGAQ